MRDSDGSYSQQADAMREHSARQLENTIASEDGSLLGGLVTLPEPLAIALRGFLPLLSGKLATFIHEPARGAFTSVAKSLGAKNAEAVGGAMAKGTALAVPYVTNALDFVGTGRQHVKERNELLATLEPLLSANKEAHKTGGVKNAMSAMFDNGYADNKMVQHALGEIKKRTYSRFTMDAVRVVPTFIVNYGSGIEARLSDEFHKHPDQRDEGLIEDLKRKHERVDLWTTGSGGLAEGLNQYAKKKANASASDTSLDKVLQLQQFIRDNALDSPNSIASGTDVSGVAARVEEVFQTFQKEQGYTHIPTHRMQEAAKIIAKELVEGDLHALSLVNLVGNEKLLNDRKDGLVSSEKIASVLKQETDRFSKNAAITSEDFLKDRPFSLDDVKAHVLSKDKDERALAAVLVPDATLIEAGMKREDIKPLRDHFSRKVQEGVFTAVIASLSQQTDEQLAEKGFSRESILFVREHDPRQEGAETIHHAMKTRASAQAAKDVVLEELMGEPSQKWQSYIASVKQEAAARLGDKSAGGKSHSLRHAKAASHTERSAQEQGVVAER